MECHVGSKGIATQTAGSHRQDSGSGLKSKEEQGRGTDYSLDYISAREVFPSPPVTVSSFSTARYTQGSRAMESSTESFVLVHPPASAAAAAAPPFVLPRAEVRTAILQHRLVQPDRSLAIDHLLALAAENLVQLYPPASESDLESLVAHLDALAAPDQAAPLVAKSCLYYLALALNADQDEEEAAEAHNYAENELLLPLPFRLAVRALVALDAGQHHLAVRWLAHPAVTPEPPPPPPPPNQPRIAPLSSSTITASPASTSNCTRSARRSTSSRPSAHRNGNAASLRRGTSRVIGPANTKGLNSGRPFSKPASEVRAIS